MVQDQHIISQQWDSELVSIIIPHYNSSELLKEAVASVLYQTYDHYEAIIVDDCSEKHERDELRVIKSTDSRIQCFFLGTNSGPAVARNFGLSKARGRWIAFLDADDYWVPTKLIDCIRHSMTYNAALVFSGYRQITACGNFYGRYISVPSTLGFNQLLGNTAIATSSVVIDRYRTGHIVFDLVFYDDFCCWLSLLRRGHKAFGLQKDLMRYRRSKSSYSANKLKSASEVWNVYRRIYCFSKIKSAKYFLSYASNALCKYYFKRPLFKIS
jgi:teichuronic acid biosynthesis glycosyltransferase TuaG